MELVEGSFFVIVVVLRCASASLALVAYICIAVYALLGRRQVIQALALLWFLTLLNPALAPAPDLGAIARYAVLISAALSMSVRAMSMRGLRISPVVFATLLLGMFLVIHALLFSVMAGISFAKEISWLLAACASFSAWSGLDPLQRLRVSRQVFAGLAIVAVASLPLLASPFGYFVNGRGFQGILDHPQVFGETMALLGAWAGGELLIRRKPSWWLLGLFGLCAALIGFSQARTAGFALIPGIALAALVTSRIAHRPVRNVLQGLRSRRFVASVLVSLALVVLGTPILAPKLGAYIAKGSGAHNIVDAYRASRGVLIFPMLNNIRVRPWRGIGFGIASDPTGMVVHRDPIFGFPVGAPVEKGVLPLAVLEELGIPGFVAAGAWLWLLVRRAARGGGVVAMTVLFTLLLENMGDSMLFSAGGMGLLLIVLLGWACSASPHRTKVGEVAHA